MNKFYVVRVVIPTIDNAPPLAQTVDSSFLECLRYAGVISLHRDDEEGQCFDIQPPRHLNASGSKIWSEQNAARMETFGYNAVSAPRTF